VSYAEGTEVPVERSKAEIEHILDRYGADGFGYLVEGDRAVVIFSAGGRKIRFTLPLPEIAEVAKTPTGRNRKPGVVDEARRSEIRRRWRALCLSIKAKLEVVECGISEFEEEFMPYIIMPNGKTVAEQIRPQIAEAYESKKVSRLLLTAE